MVRPIQPYTTPPRPDGPLDHAREHLAAAEQAASRGSHAANKEQLIDAITSIRFFTAEAEKQLSEPQCSRSWLVQSISLNKVAG